MAIRKQTSAFDGDPLEASLPSNTEEMLAMIEGELAIYQISQMPAGPGRSHAFHALRRAAKIDPIAAYNLGLTFSESAETLKRPWAKRDIVSLKLFERAIEIGCGRLSNPSQSSKNAPSKEMILRDIISRALTNVGGFLANSGYQDRAVEYFRRSLVIFEKNPVTHVSLGNMGVYHSGRSGIDPLKGVAEWSEAAKYGDYCHESNDGCPCRNNIVRIVNQIGRDYGSEHARKWIELQYRVACKEKKATYFKPVACGAADIARLTKTPWPRDAVFAADFFGEKFKKFKNSPLPTRVTLVASLIASLKSDVTSQSTSNAKSFYNLLVERVSTTEPLFPFLGDHEWKYCHPPETDYLLDIDVALTIRSDVSILINNLVSTVGQLTVTDAILGVLFHLDDRFRRGVTFMAAHATPPTFYLPAIVIGSPPNH